MTELSHNSIGHETDDARRSCDRPHGTCSRHRNCDRAVSRVRNVSVSSSIIPVVIVPANPLAETDINNFPPTPRIEEHPATEIGELAFAGRRILSTYGWMDKKAGMVRIPIDRAMELQLERGFPARKEGVRNEAPSDAGSCFAGSLALAQVQTGWRPALLRSVGIDQKMGAQVPLDLPFNDESGRPVTLRQYLGKPVILALVYYQCPSLCNMVLNGVLRSVKNLTMTAGDRIRYRRRQLRSARNAGNGRCEEGVVY